MPAEKQGTTRTTAVSRSTRSTDRPTRPAGAAKSARPARSRPAPQESAFSTAFMDRVRRREADDCPGGALSETPLARRARWIGPWQVEEVPAGSNHLHAATRRSEPAREGGGARMACQQRQDSLLGAVTFAGLAVPNELRLNTDKASGRRSALGHPVHDGARHIGHVSRVVEGSEEEFLAYYHMVRCLAADPEALALLLEALDPETLAMVGRAVMRRVG